MVDPQIILFALIIVSLLAKDVALLGMRKRLDRLERRIGKEER